MAQRLEFDIFAKDSASSSFLRAGRAAAAASDDVMGLARRLDEVGRKSADVRVNLKGNTEALAQLDKLNAKLLVTGRRITPDISIEGAAKASLEITALNAQIDKLGSKSEDATGAVGEAGLSGPEGLGALLGAGIALSPVIATVGTGLAGLGLAAAGAVKPIEKASQKAGGLRANLSALNPEQKKLAGSLLGLGQQYHAFSKALEPEVVSVFGEGIKLASHLMQEAEPVAKATGKAFGGVLGNLDAQLSSPQWTQFFSWMKTQAAPDVKQLGDTFVNLAASIPPVVENLRPLADDLLASADGMSNLVRATAQLGSATGRNGQQLHGWQRAFQDVMSVTEGGVPLVKDFWHWMSGLGNAGKTGAQGVSLVGAAARAAGNRVAFLNQDLTDLNNLLSDQSAEIAWKQAQQAATKAIEGGSKALDGNSKKSLANRAQVISSTQAALAFAQQQEKTGHDVNGASSTLSNQIKWLERAHDKSAWMRAELGLLRKALNALHDKHLMIDVEGHGVYSVQAVAKASGHHGSTLLGNTGMLVPGFGGGDRWPALLEGGEAVVPKHLTPAVAPFLKAHGVPGFAAGYVPSIATRDPAALGPWLTRDYNATTAIIEQATAQATTAAVTAAVRSAPMVNIENFNSLERADVNILAQQLSFRITASGLG